MAALPAWLVLRSVTVNLPPGTRNTVVLAVEILAALVGFLVGGSALRRAAHGSSHIRLFVVVAAAVGGALIGAGIAAAVTAGYLQAYGVATDGLTGQAALVLAYPVFAGLGAVAGAIVGAFAGLLGGSLLAVFAPARL